MHGNVPPKGSRGWSRWQLPHEPAYNHIVEGPPLSTRHAFIHEYVKRNPDLNLVETEDGVWSYTTHLLIAVPCSCLQAHCTGWEMIAQDALVRSLAYRT